MFMFDPHCEGKAAGMMGNSCRQAYATCVALGFYGADADRFFDGFAMGEDTMAMENVYNDPERKYRP